MSGMLLACSMLMSDASLSWERPTDPPGRPAKPWKRLCSPVKQNPDWGFLVFIPRHCEIHRFEKRPRSAGSWELATGIVYKWGAKYAHPQKNGSTMSSLQIPPYSKKERQWKVGGEKIPSLSGDRMVAYCGMEWSLHGGSPVTKDGQRRIEVMYPSMALWEPSDGSLLLGQDLAPPGWTTLPLGAKWFWTASWDSLPSWGTSNQPLSSRPCSTTIIPGLWLIKLLKKNK